jgi:predicted nucleic acid-binding protein
LRVYAESSAILAWLLGESGADAVRAVLEGAELAYASDLTLVECDRGLIRLEVIEQLTPIEAAERRAILAQQTRYWALLRLEEEVIERARRRYPHEPIRSLDALHLASALLAARTATGVEVLTLDERVRQAGRALGFKILPAPGDISRSGRARS